MSERYYAGAYWACHPESAQQCARRAETFPTFDTFVRFFGMKKHQSGGDGFGFGAWTGHVPVNQAGGMVTLVCGSPAEAAPNNVLLYFPMEGPGLDRLLTLPVMTGVLRAMALAWEPDWAVAVSDEFRDLLPLQGNADTFVGWLTYFSRQRGEVPALPEPVRVEPVEDKGTLVILGPEPLSVANPEHVALGLHVQQVLKERGLLKRIIERRT